MNLYTILLGLIAVETSYLTASRVRHNNFGSLGKQSVFVDTSALIDGRIVEIARAGFLTDSMLYITRSVIAELQFLADHGDADKRSRARFGLDQINALRQLNDVDIKVFRDEAPAEEGVDTRLLRLAQQRRNSCIMTVDYNLNKVAQVENTKILNVNDLALALRLAHLPGDRLDIDLLQKGQEKGQAVGHLDDGTMVVIDKAEKLIGKTVAIEVVRSFQTAAGRMIFAKLVSSNAKRTFSNNEAPRSRKGKPTDGKKQERDNNNNVTTKSRRKSSEEDKLIALVHDQH